MLNLKYILKVTDILVRLFSSFKTKLYTFNTSFIIGYIKYFIPLNKSYK